MDVLERGPQLKTLDDRLADARHGHGSLVLVSGEAGIGKTTLAATFCERHTADAVTWWGSCDAMRAARPLGPLHDIAPSVGGALAELIAGDAGRHRVLAALLSRLTEPGPPRILVVEDVHWADEATLDMLLFLGRRVADARTVLVATYRDDEVHSGHPLRTVMGDLATMRSVHRVAVLPLSRDGVRILAHDDGTDGDRLFEVTGGNPFFVTELLAAQAEAGDVPPTIRDAVLARLARLNPAARAAADIAAIVPNQVEVALLLAAGATDAAIDECQQAGILLGSGPTVRFRHELARLAVEQAVPVARRTRLHALILTHLTAATADPARLSHHADEAGDDAAVLSFAPLAARAASRVGAHRQAAAHYARALRFAGGTPAAIRAELQEQLSEECSSAGLLREALHASQAAMALWREAGDRDREGELMARRGHYLWFTGQSERAYEATAAAVEMLEQGPPGRGLAAAYTHLAYLRMLARDIPAAITAGRKAIALADEFGAAHLRTRALNALGTAQWFHEPDLAAGTLVESIAAAQGDDAARAAAMCNLGSGAGEIRRYALADQWLSETLAWSVERDLDAYRGYAIAWLARSHFEQGRWAEAEALAADPYAVDSTHVPTRIVALTVSGRLRGRRGEQSPELEEALRLALQTGDLQRLWPAVAATAETAWLLGLDRPAALEPTYEQAARLGHTWARGELALWLRRFGVPVAVEADDIAEPYALQLTGHAREAAAAWHELGCPYDEADALAESGERGDLVRAHAILAELGAWPAADRIARRLREVGVRLTGRPRQSTMDNPAQLTDRQVEVLRLLAADLRNADIAARLHISAKTVDHHVSAILAKLGVASRWEAARAAANLLDP